MNLNWKQSRVPFQVLLISILCIGLLFLVYMVAFRRSPLEADAQQKANSTKTALALTAGSLLGPFPTSTAPTPTPSDTPTLTPTLPTATPTASRTPTRTPTLIPTFTPRTLVARPTGTSIAIIPSNTAVPPSNTPVAPTDTSVPATQPSADTDTPAPPATQPPNIITAIVTLLP